MMLSYTSSSTPSAATMRMSWVVQRCQRFERSAAHSTMPIPAMQAAQISR
jgi:hypothetical protein